MRGLEGAELVGLGQVWRGTAGQDTIRLFLLSDYIYC